MRVISELRVRKKKKKKKYRVPLKTSDKKAHMIPELQSPIPSPKAASAFLSVWMLRQHGGREKIEDKAETGEMWQFSGDFHGEGRTGAEGVILGLLTASRRWIKMVGYGKTIFFVYFFVCPCLISCKFEPLSRPIKLNRTCASLPRTHRRLSSRVFWAPIILRGEVCNLLSLHKLDAEATEGSRRIQ